MKVVQTILILALAIIPATGLNALANTRTIETRFALSADARSEFSTKFPLLGPGRIVVEANWNAPQAPHSNTSLTLVMIDTNGSTISSKTGVSSLLIEHRATEQDFGMANSTPARWTVKILNDDLQNRAEVSGVLRITVPANTRVLEDTQFTLLGSGNAQEIAFEVPGPGRIEIAVNWAPDGELRQSEQAGLEVSLIHPGESRTYARRQGSSPISVDQQVTEQALDRGGRWIVRIQNAAQAKISGTVKVVYSPGL